MNGLFATGITRWAAGKFAVTQTTDVQQVELCTAFAQRIGLDSNRLLAVRRGAILHDIGKFAVPERILLKPGPLDDAEWQIVLQHPVFARQLLSPIGFLHQAMDIPYAHHERWDGTGYPQGLPGERIPLPARMFALVDVWDSLTSERPYRPAWTQEKALTYITEQSGRHFDPTLVPIFLDLLRERLRPTSTSAAGRLLLRIFANQND